MKLRAALTSIAVAGSLILAPATASAASLSWSDFVPTELTPVVVLGAKTSTFCQSPEVLNARVDKAAEWAGNNKLAPVITTGGNTSKCPASEAQVMELKLRAHKVLNPIFRDDRAGSTVENARNVAEMLPAGSPVALVTTADHMPRALANFRDAGLKPFPVTA